jgi:multiple antibiotic resistance protein
VLLLSQGVHGLLGPLGQKLLLRFFGLILVAIGVQFILAGAYEFFTDAMAEQALR